jgi:putative transposase
VVNYRRNFTPGGTFFITVALQDRRSHGLIEYIDSLCQAFQETRKTRPFRIDAIVILPEHLHMIWTVPSGDANDPTR